MSPLIAWNSFYVIVGTSAGALTGLTFVVITLVAVRSEPGTGWGVTAFTSPTFVHLCTVLLVSAILSAPWPTLSQAALVLGLCGLGGLVYSVIVVRRLRLRIAYEPLWED